MIYSELQMLLRLVTCTLMLLAVAIQRSGSVVGYEHMTSDALSDTIVLSGSNTDFIIDTRLIAADVKGYGGSTPLRITVTNGKISGIETLRNAETPEFFHQVKDKLLSRYIGMTPENVLRSQVDAVAGATLSSRAVMETMRLGMAFAINQDKISGDYTAWSIFSPKFIITLCVVLGGAFIPLFIKNRRYRFVQLALNVLVVGFWSGSFLSYSLIISYLSNGMNLLYSIVPLVLLVSAFVYPFFGRKSHYCVWQCPLGSLQELVGDSVRYKWKLSPKALRYLSYFHDGLWAVLMLLMWSGVCFKWMDYELFTAFIMTKASRMVIAIALLFVVLSFVVKRPYCRFVCPTGNLFRIIQNP